MSEEKTENFGISKEVFESGIADARTFNEAVDTVDLSLKTISDVTFNLQPDVTLAGATPAQADVASWDIGDRGIGIGTDSSIHLMYKDGAASVKSATLA